MMYRVRPAVFLKQCSALALPLVSAAALLLAASAVGADPATQPDNATPARTAPAAAAAEKPAPDKATADKAATDKAAAVKATPDKAAPDKAAPKAPPRKVLLEKSAKPEKGIGEEAPPAQALPTNVSAVYRIRFGMLGEIGNFRFKSHIEGETYTLAADAKIDTSIFDYVGDMKSSGAVLRASLAQPLGYKFKYRQKALFGKKKIRSLSMAFEDGGVKGVTFVPPDPPSNKAIPVTKEQLQSALDPLSGVMALSLGDMDHPCDQRLPIFDGKQRFDLVFQPTGRKDGPGGGQVCHVRLIPISGHKPGEGAGSVITGKIEVVLRPVPKANILIPHRVTVPTIIGAAELMSEKVDITMPDRQRIALRR